ncbi:VWA domain-containing protein [Candidatus Woesearchaeota archaeon]|nr:VWA domain-containing protein [Candidatus Woesearchaeota archaeon]
MGYMGYMGRVGLGLTLVGLPIVYALSGCGGQKPAGGPEIVGAYNLQPPDGRKVDTSKKSLALIVDTSGSMGGSIDGKTKFESAKHSLNVLLDNLNAHQEKSHFLEAGLFSFSGDTVINNVPIQAFNYGLLRDQIKKLEANANTPLGLALAYAETSLDREGKGLGTIVLLTDGMNNVGEEPDVVAEQIKQANAKYSDYPTRVIVIPFATDPKPFNKLEKQGVKVIPAEDAQALMDAFRKVEELIMEAPE